MTKEETKGWRGDSALIEVLISLLQKDEIIADQSNTDDEENDR